MYGKCYIFNTSTYTCKSGTYLGSIIDNSVIMFHEIIEVKKTYLAKKGKL